MAEYIENVAAQASKLDWAFPFERKGQFPLDRSALFSSLTDAQAYATGEAADSRKLGGTSYVGQIITVYEAAVEENKEEGIEAKPATVNAYLIGQGRQLVKLAATTASGDLAADVVVLQSQVATLNNAIDAINNRVGNGGDEPTGLYKEIEEIWNNPNGLGIGARTDDATHSPAHGLWGAVEALEGRATALEGKEDKDTTYSVAEGDKVLKLTGTEFSTELGLKHENGKISLTGINGEVIAEFSDADFIADGVLEDVSYNAETKELTFTWNVLGEDGQKKTDVVDISDLIDTYTAGNGIDITGAVVSAKVKTDEKYLKVGADGLYTEGIDEAIAKAIEELPKEDNDTTYTLTGNGVTVTLTPSNGDAADSVTLDAYTKSETDTKIDEKIASVTGGESAADVKLALETYRDALNKEVWGDDAGAWTTSVTEDGKVKVTYNPQYNTKSRIDKLEEVGAQANVIEEIQVNGTTQAINDKKVNITVPTKLSDLDDDKNYLTNVRTKAATPDGEGTVTYEPWLAITNGNSPDVRVIDDSIIQSKVNAAQKRADDAYDLADDANTAAGNAQKRADDAYGLAEEALERANDAYDLADGALVGVKIGDKEFTVKDKIASITANDALEALSLNNQNAIAETLGLGDLAFENSIDTGVHAVSLTSGTTNGTIALVVDDQKSDDIAVTGLNTMAYEVATDYYTAAKIAKIIGFENEFENSGMLPGDDVRLSVLAEIDKLKEDIGNVSNIMNFRGVVDTEAEGFNADEPFAQIADPKDGDVVLYGEQEYVYNNGIWVLFGDATGNAAAITALAERVTDVETAVNTTLPGAIAQALTDAKTYTDQEIGKIVLPGAAQQSILGLIKGTDNKVNVADGEITGISTDLLFQGLNELILNGGNADVAASN